MKYVHTYKMFEGITSDLITKYIDKYRGIKKELLQKVNDSLPNSDLNTLKETFEQLVSTGIKSGIIPNLVQEDDIYSFYKKNQEEIDTKCKEAAWFEQSASQKNIDSLYSYVVEGSTLAINLYLKEIQEDLFIND